MRCLQVLRPLANSNQSPEVLEVSIHGLFVNLGNLYMEQGNIVGAKSLFELEVTGFQKTLEKAPELSSRCLLKAKTNLAICLFIEDNLEATEAIISPLLASLEETSEPNDDYF